MFKQLTFAALILFPLHQTLAQSDVNPKFFERQSNRRSPKEEIVLLQKYLKSPPPIGDPRWVIGLIENRSVREELGVDAATFARFQEIAAKSLRERLEVSSKLHDSDLPGSLRLLGALETEILQEELSQLRGLLTIEQEFRLEQLKWYAEVARMSLGNSLAFGMLGREVGVYENQQDLILRTASKAEDDLELKTNEVLEKCHEDILATLSIDQKAQAVGLLGKFFVFDEPFSQSFSRDFADLRDSNSLQAEGARVEQGNNEYLKSSFIARDESRLFHLLQNRSIRREIAFTETQWHAYKDYKEKTRVDLMNQLRVSAQQGIAAEELEARLQKAGNKMSADRGASVDELLQLDQISRLIQLARFVEISCKGYAESMCNGTLRQDLGIGELQAKELRPMIEKIEKNCQNEIRAISSSAWKTVFGKLSSEQQKRANGLLGTFFAFKDPRILAMHRKLADLTEEISTSPNSY